MYTVHVWFICRKLYNRHNVGRKFVQMAGFIILNSFLLKPKTTMYLLKPMFRQLRECPKTKQQNKTTQYCTCTCSNHSTKDLPFIFWSNQCMDLGGYNYNITNQLLWSTTTTTTTTTTTQDGVPLIPAPSQVTNNILWMSSRDSLQSSSSTHWQENQ